MDASTATERIQRDKHQELACREDGEHFAQLEESSVEGMSVRQGSTGNNAATTSPGASVLDNKLYPAAAATTPRKFPQPGTSPRVALPQASQVLALPQASQVPVTVESKVPVTIAQRARSPVKSSEGYEQRATATLQVRTPSPVQSSNNAWRARPASPTQSVMVPLHMAAEQRPLARPASPASALHVASRSSTATSQSSAAQLLRPVAPLARARPTSPASRDHTRCLGNG
eukprot:gnl/TRDRNA2_/TRDRNA2_120782_c3_seq1.p1 gnl/TRDRNA2_/TRDRNA2_120782_c3~~gnl/TRDRNA2_/TRDRNA2_120782_c3_seq1.p1  ORF type:complete len:245 (+),score=41.69 gnl/TRDRNA2_/TRDRNA2_120782_c3_seq1:48-737(+)